jgi:peptide/nickel transport system ATP-binding protein
MGPSSETKNPLVVTNLSVSFLSNGRAEDVIRNVSFSVRSNEVLIFLGESGSGKTILARSLTRLFPVASSMRIDGSVIFEGLELLTLAERALAAVRRHRLRYVFQEPMQSLNPVAKISHQMQLAYDHPSRDDTILRETLRLVGVADSEEVLNRFPHELSIGTAQRVCIALAVLSAPALLIADEPTSAVDATLRRKIFDLLMSIQRSQPMSLILITHDLDVARWYGDRIIVVHGGQIIESAPRAAFCEQPFHPYSRSLLVAHTSGLTHTTTPDVIPAPGKVGVPHQGCAFQWRCPSARKDCGDVEPVLEQLSGEREVRCLYWK